MFDAIGLDRDSLQIIGHVAIAVLLGAILGIERELAQKPAGLRTHMLVAAAAALFAGLNQSLVQQYSAVGGDTVRGDPLRIIDAVITGVSFLGAGTILRNESGDRIEGLTTAGSLLLCAAVGLAVAVDRTAVAVAITLLAVLVLAGLRPLERRIARRVRQSAPEDSKT